MKNLLRSLILLAPLTLVAQTGRTVTLTWTDTANPAGTTYNVKRAVGLCSGTPTFSTIISGVTAKTYADANVAVGNYCYVVTAVFSGLESAASNTAGAGVLPVPPTLNSPTVAQTEVVVRPIVGD